MVLKNGTDAKTAHAKPVLRQPTEQEKRVAKLEAISVVTSFSTASAIVEPSKKNGNAQGTTAAHVAVVSEEAAGLRALLDPNIALLENGKKETVLAFGVYNWASVAREVVEKHQDWLALAGMSVINTNSYPVREESYSTIKEIINAKHPEILPKRGFANLFGLLRPKTA